MPAGAAVALEREGVVARVVLDRPEKRNAFDDHLARALREAFEGLSADRSVRVVVLAGRGPVFCAGGDLDWMRRAADYAPERNLEDAADFQRAFEAIDRCPKPVVARVQGPAIGGGCGLVAACDIAVVSEEAVFSLPEVRLGIVPGVVAPLVLRRIGPGEARRLFLTGERIDAAEARRIGLVHRVVPAASLDTEVARVVGELLLGAPDGQRRAKELIRALERATTHEEASERARRAIADARASEDGREGIRAFLERRKPRWAP
jgi:methylglutaconyl-CoA hydratase